VPEILRNAEIHLPLRYAKLLWGWPDRFMERMEEAGVFFVLVDGEGRWSEGFDTEEDIARIPPGFRVGYGPNGSISLGLYMTEKTDESDTGGGT
jgi:hypothetical protein